jgi:hypothetical protein
MNEERLEHFLLVHTCNTHTLSLSLTCEQGVHTLFTGQRERGREKESEMERGREREREREVYNIVIELAGALAPFSYLVKKK